MSWTAWHSALLQSDAPFETGQWWSRLAAPISIIIVLAAGTVWP